MIQRVHLRFQYDDKVLKKLVFQSAQKFYNNKTTNYIIK